MKKIRAIICIIASVLLFAGCSDVQAPGSVDVLPIEPAPSDAPAAIVTPAPAPIGQMPEQSSGDVTMGNGEIEGLHALDVSYSTTRSLFPEGAAEESADYALTLNLPDFSAAPQEKAELYAALQGAVDVLKDDALTRVTEERLPLSDRADGAPVPQTELTIKAYTSGSYYELVALESYSYDGTDSNEHLSACVFTSGGAEVSLGDLVGGYDARAVTAQQVYNVIDRVDGAFYNDVSLDDIAIALDVYNGFAVTDAGVVILFAPGTVAPEEAFTQRVTVKRAALWPDTVNDAITNGLFTADEYAAMLPMLHALACAVAPNYESFTGSAPSVYAATAFMTQIFTSERSAQLSPIPFLNIDKAEYESVFASYFSSAMPALEGDAPVTDGTALSADGTHYSVPLMTLSAYAFRPETCSVDGGALILTGALISGAQGEGAEESVMATAHLKLIKDSAAACGYKIDSVTLS